MGNPVEYTGKNSQVGPSPAIWASCPTLDFLQNPALGIHLFDDFTNFPAIAPAAAGTKVYNQVSGYGAFVDTTTTASSLKQLATEQGGVLQATTGATDNHVATLVTGGNTAGAAKITQTNGRLWFEARIRLGQIDDSGFAVGLSQEALATLTTNVFATGAATMTVIDFVGFRTLSGNPSEIDAVYATAGGAEVVVKEIVQTAVAATWYKLGVTFDGDTTVKYYLNGVEIGTVEISVANFPDGEELGMLFACKNGTAAARTYDMDWWRLAAERVA